MTQYYARTDVSYSGGDKLFSITFPYIKKEHIKVFVNGELTDNYTYITASQIRIDDELELDDEISIRRTTPIDERMVVFSDTSILNKDAQNLDSDQLFDVVQEIYDNNTSFKFDTTEQIENIEAKADGALQNVEEAISIANTAETKADNAISIANTASDNADTAVSIANSANTSAQSAVSTANSATVAANQAVLSANDAKDIAEGAESTALSSKERVDEFDASITAVLDAAEQIEELQSAIDDAIEAAEAAQQAAASLVIDDELDDTSEQPVQNKVVKAAIDAKQDELESGTNIKTIGNQSIIGSGNIDIKTVDSQSIMGSGNVDINNIIEQNSNEKTKLWVGTYSQYQLLGNQYFGWDNTSTVFTKTQTPDETTQFYDSSADEISAVCSSFYAWKYESIIVYTKSATPAVGDFIGFSGSNTITISNDAITSIATDSISDGTITYTRDTSSDLIQTNETIYCTLHGANTYDKVTRYSTADFTDGDAAYNANTIYICTDTGSIYKGATQIIVNGSDKVSKSGDTMTGTLQMSSSVSPQIIIKDTSQVAGTPPASGEQLTKIEFQDSNGTMIGYIQNVYNADGERSIMINTRNGDCSDRATLILGFDANGDAYSQGVNPKASSNGTQIATAAWVKNFGKTSGTNYLSQFSKASNGYYKFTNGLIIQWGHYTNANGLKEITFPTAFTSTNYFAKATYYNETSYLQNYYGFASSLATTKCKFHGSTDTAAKCMWLAIGY